MIICSVVLVSLNHCIMQLREEEEEDLVEGQGVRERRRLAGAARVVCVHVCGRVVCTCSYTMRAE